MALRGVSAMSSSSALPGAQPADPRHGEDPRDTPQRGGRAAVTSPVS